MTPEAQRIAIAEACGWTKVHWYEDNAGPNILSGIPYLTEEEILRTDERELNNLRTYGKTVPNYLSDLNAMREVECSAGFNSAAYELTLEEVVNREFHEGGILVWPLWHATAAQKAEAFLRSIGKWDDSR